MADEEPRFENGAIVRLRSGGPIMTVAGYDLYGRDDHKTYRCRWFDAEQNLIENNFEEWELEEVEVRERHA
jgi:uncharacterized protein YodC (DUF2158 family)